MSLAIVKSQQLFRIDTECFERIISGFSYDSETFSLSTNSQIKWLTWRVLEDELTYPVKTSVLDNSSIYSIADTTAMSAITDAALGTFGAKYGSAMSAKEAVLAAATEAAAITAADDYVLNP